MTTSFGRLLKAELKLMLRDPLVLTFVFVFPVLTMLIIGGSFGTEPDPGFANRNPSHWYVASYLTVVIAATGLIMLPVHLASYRERGVLLGMLLPSARAAQAVGLMLFFPSFLLGAGGPPPHAMGATMRSIADVLPLSQVTDAVRDPWLGLGTATGSLIVVAVLAAGASVLAARRATL
ncbi:MAG: hypothetical protein M3065_01070 [Actinomycetota bacterium]|nr:hypothetical protein [Actinomycetota bacterium]